MNCANHPEIAAAAYCQNCGKPLCSSCVRSVPGVIYCEQCLAVKLGMGGAPPAGYNINQGGQTVTGSTSGEMNFTAAGIAPPSGIPNPSTATLLGFIPGVGAMYNGQFVKALVHVLVFVVLIGITDNHGIFGIFIAAWIAYQVFDANQTAKARRDGLPLPDPFGLNELGAKIGIANSQGSVPFTQTYTGAPYTGSAIPPIPPVPPIPPAPGAAAGYGPAYADSPAYTNVPPYSGDPNMPVPGMPISAAPMPRREPVGAIVLIGLGLLFLFNTLGIFRFNWIGHFWPLFIIALGAWLLIRRMGGNVGFAAKIKGPKQDGPPAPPAGGGQ